MGAPSLHLRRRWAHGLASLLILLFLTALDWSGPSAELVLSVPEESTVEMPSHRRAGPVWIEMIRGARRTIDVEQFYVFSEPGRPLEPVLAELRAAGERGVRIRFLVSSSMTGNDTITPTILEAIPNLEYRILDYDAINDGTNHSKYWIVDGETFFVGSQNFDWRSLSQIHEMGLLVQDRRLARKLGEIFSIDWEIARSGRFPTAGELRRRTGSAEGVSRDVELVGSPPELLPRGVRPALGALTALIDSASRSITVQLLSYNPASGREKYWDEIDRALRRAAVRGVKVRLMVADWNVGSSADAHLKALSLMPNCEVRIVTVPPHSSGFIPYARVIHSKAMVVDGSILWIGTSNWSRSYFTNQRNVELIVRRQELAASAAKVFEAIWSSPMAAPIDVAKRYPSVRRG